MALLDHVTSGPGLTSGFLTPHRKRAKTLQYRLFANKRRRLDALGWPFRTMLGWPILSRVSSLLAFLEAHGRWPDFARTGYLNDYLYRLKITGENSGLRRRTSDKELVKEYLSETLGRDLAIPTLAVIRDPQALDGFSFPRHTIIKPTHMSGIVYYCGERQPSAADRLRMRAWFDIDYGRISSESNYQGLTPKIIVEPFLALNDRFSSDVRFYVYNGEVTIIEVVGGRFQNPTIDFFDPEWNHLVDFWKNGCGHSQRCLPRPRRLVEMIGVAKTIGRDFSFVRVDFFTDFADRLYIGELTHISGNCRDRIVPVEAERYFVEGAPRPLPR